MTFKEKIRTIVRVNRLGINSASALERVIGASVGSITKSLRKNEEPGEETIKKILALPGLNEIWWNTGEGDVFCITTDEKPTHEQNKPTLMKIDNGGQGKSINDTIDDLIGMLKEDNAFLKDQYKKLQESNEKLRASLDTAYNDYVKLTTITLTHGQK